MSNYPKVTVTVWDEDIVKFEFRNPWDEDDAPESNDDDGDYVPPLDGDDDDDWGDDGE